MRVTFPDSECYLPISRGDVSSFFNEASRVGIFLWDFFEPVIDFCVKSRAEASWVGCDVGVNELEGVRPIGGVIESVRALEMSGVEGRVGG